MKPMRARACARLGPVMLAALLMPAAGTARAADEVATVTVQEPRAFGHVVGDRVTRIVTVHVPAGSAFDESSLPQSARRGQALELRQVTQRSRWQLVGSRHELTLVYQVFLSPPEVRTLELPPLTLRVKGPSRIEDLRVDAWPLTVAPLAPAEAPVREGLGELRPDAAPPLIDTGPARARLTAYFVLLLLAAGYLGHVYLGLPWWARRRRPFTMAWRALRGLPESAFAERRQEMFKRVHEALNQTAGQVLFEPDIERFITAHPQFAGQRAELALFFQRSREQFFAGAAAEATDHDAWLRRFCKACCDAERGAA
ncbi:hypothetical protein [Aquabacterium sp.]|uniref:hypothetical protein n=1 Tax=Aquabacterium sp. TaxID=1872578 RepID=UPI002B977B3D|nr:hypothetical protein [Aquabacterium sp.]HSW06975.1 hypothetical protein [Aquabacterium sp.]